MNEIKSSLKTKQSSLFLDGEGDNWFDRNKNALLNYKSSYEIDVIKKLLNPFKSKIHSICEIGSGNGAKLNEICSYFNAKGYGVDPSSKAVNFGNNSFGNINLKVSTATNLPYLDASFDLVFFGFCLYLVDRNDIFKAIAEADRVLKNGGFLAIFDFDPGLRSKRAYSHKDTVFSYKNSYSNFFTSGGHYYLLGKESFSHNENFFSIDSNERLSLTILYKELDAY